MDNRIEYIHFTYELGIFNEKIAKCVAEPYDFDIAQVPITTEVLSPPS